MPHGFVVAQLSVATQECEVRHSREDIKGGRSDSRHVPEEVELRDTLQAGKTHQAFITERAIDQQVNGITFAPGFEEGEILKKCETRVGNEPACVEASQVRLTTQCLYDTITRSCSHYSNAFELLTILQVR